MRIGINVPNELLRRLEPLKPELNISQVCREALEAKAESYEQMQARLDDAGVQAAVARVWEQEKEFLTIIEVDWTALGYQDAKAWVQAAHRKHWDYLHHDQTANKEKGRPERAVRPSLVPGVKNFDQRFSDYERNIMNQSDEFLDWLYDEDKYADRQVAHLEYMTAWMAYTKAVWELVRQKEREYLEEQSRQRRETRRNRPAPEAPEHLLADIRPQDLEPYEVVPHHAGFAPGVDPENPKRILADLDVEDYLAKQERIQ